MPIITADQTGIAKAAAALLAGECVAFPTETVYGLGADALQDQAVAKIYALKNRPTFNPLIIHVAEPAQLAGMATLDERARELAHCFWPGALTLVLPATLNCPVSRLARAGLPSVAVRVPAHPVAQALLRAVGRPLAAPSANRSGGLSPTTPLHVQHSLGDNAPLILAGGKTMIGVESTILDLTSATLRLLRHGGISTEQIAACLGIASNTIAEASGDKQIEQRPIAPGQFSSHYAPNLPLRLSFTTAQPDEGLLLFGSELGLKGGAVRLNLSKSGDLHEAAANLFVMLHELDSTSGLSGIAVSAIPEIGLGRAINDRLNRAAAPRE